MPLRRLPLSLTRDHAIEATRVSIGKLKLVYVLVADKRISYGKYKSRVVYIGTTKNGAARIAGSVAARAEVIPGLRGVRKFHARIVTCAPRQHVKTWRLLERALILEFKALHGCIPTCNTHGARFKERNEFKVFSRKRIRGILEDLA